jgi:hypothetical protein
VTADEIALITTREKNLDTGMGHCGTTSHGGEHARLIAVELAVIDPGHVKAGRLILGSGVLSLDFLQRVCLQAR